MDIFAQHVSYLYNLGSPYEVSALSDISLDARHGETLGISGGVGSGKSTLIRLFNGLLLPAGGAVYVDGVDTRKADGSLRKRVGIVFQRPERQLFERTVYGDISFVLRRFSGLSEASIRDKVDRACAELELDIERIADRAPWQLSEGEKRKVAIAGILVNEPEVLILDEPAVGMDLPSIAELARLIARLKSSGDRTIIIVAHDMDWVLPLLDKIAVLNKGRLAAWGAPEQVANAMESDAELSGLLPDLILLAQGLRRAGIPVEPGDYSADDLARSIERLAHGEGV